MPAFNIRNVDLSLMRQMRIRAAESDLTLRDWALHALTAAAFATPKAKKEPKPKPEPKTEVHAEPVAKYCRHGLSFCEICQETTVRG